MVPKIKLIHHCQNENESIKLQALKDLISDSSASDETINEFIRDKEVIDIKLSTGKYERVVLVMYEDKGGIEMENESDLKDLTDAIKKNKDKKRYSLDDIEKELEINDDDTRE